MDHFPPAILAEATTQPMLKIPYDTAPFEAVIGPGESVILYGKIEVFNAAEEAVLARTHFELKRGFVLTVQGEQLQTLLTEQVLMHHRYTLCETERGWELTPST